MILPGATLGMLGGGQLGRMFTLTAREMGYKVLVLDPDPESPAGRVADLHLQRPYNDPGAIERMIQHCSAVTTEFENVPAEVLETLAVRLPVRPGAKAVAAAQDRLTEKAFLQRNGFATVGFYPVLSAADVELGTASVPGPWILKTARLGYDGKGQARVANAADAQAAFDAHRGVPCILEQQVPLDLEVSVVLARGEDGRTAVFPPGENVHHHGILETTTVPARLPGQFASHAAEIAIAIAEALEYVGVLGVEMFLSGGQLLVNELAPRPHNSGHWTQDAAASSQFEQQVRALCGLPLGDPRVLTPVTMINILGDVWEGGEPDWGAALTDAGVKLHLYGKSHPRPGRKMGHLNVLGGNAVETLHRAHRALRVLSRGR
ncbi:MAG TPA: 5-(carboxyamino)imidazole ribonucleotide synthase [Gemmatimonadales bacterium]|nr:5-(carboxyamino)imidazole ribonucleotide synthase [Gemmatimonadales bacterium]